MDRLVDSLETVTEGLLHVADAMELSVVRSHHSAIVTDKLIVVVAVVTQGLAVEHAHLRLRNMWVQNRLRLEGTLCCHPAHSTADRSGCDVIALVRGLRLAFGVRLAQMTLAHLAHGLNVAWGAGDIIFALSRLRLALFASGCRSAAGLA